METQRGELREVETERPSDLRLERHVEVEGEDARLRVEAQDVVADELARIADQVLRRGRGQGALEGDGVLAHGAARGLANGHVSLADRLQRLERRLDGVRASIKRNRFGGGRSVGKTERPRNRVLEVDLLEVGCGIAL